jgi:hypothetical protein
MHIPGSRPGVDEIESIEWGQTFPGENETVIGL